MASITTHLSLLFILLTLSSELKVTECARNFTIINYCKETIWPAIMPGESFTEAGFVLKPGQSKVFNAPVGWSGRIWARTACNFDTDAHKGTCETGACGQTLKCTTTGRAPASLAEFTLANVDYYDVSLVDGFNLPVVVTPLNGNGSCSIAGCDGDLRANCPAELAVKSKNGKVVGCRSACDVFNTDEYCCRGVYGNPVVCKQSYYSKKFKEACPSAYSFAYDDPTSIFTCSGGTDYVVAFCASRNQKVCTYHNKQLACGGSTGGSQGSKSLTVRWTALMVATLLLVHW